MQLHLLRHARSAKRAQWTGPAWMRPLVETGHEQARAIAAALGDHGIQRIVSSPALRCRQTAAPLALALGLPVEIDERLQEGADEAKAYELVASFGDAPTVVCTHGETIGALLERFRQRGFAIEEEPRCEKGSTWSLAAAAKRSARYAPPPATAAGDTLERPTIRFAVLDLGSTSFHLLVADATADDVFLPVATAALRDAANGAEVAERIGAAFGVETRILSGAEEARLTFAAFRRKLRIGTRSALGIDLGGGSLELITGDERDVHFDTTLTPSWCGRTR
jgi:phosphohistidine phosphatase SixA